MLSSTVGSHPPAAVLRPPQTASRGTVLCVFEDRHLVETLEPAVVTAGFTLLRARHGMHGFWMAMTARPQLIIAEITRDESASNYLLISLARQPKTAGIPVIALVDARNQVAAQVSRLQHATTCFPRTVTPGELVNEAARILERPSSLDSPGYRSKLARAAACFSDLSHPLSGRPQWLRHSGAAADSQSHRSLRGR